MAGNRFYTDLNFGSGRYKIIVVSVQSESFGSLCSDLKGQGFPLIDVGYELSLLLSTFNNPDHIPIEAQDGFKNLLNRQYSIHQQKPLFLYNLGILLDPVIKLNPISLLKSISRNIPVVILWEYAIDTPCVLHWGEETENYKLDFNEIYPYIIVVNDEI